MHDNGNLMIDGALVTAPFPVTNYRDDGEPHFWATRRISPLRHCVLHETAGRSAASAKRTLKNHPKHYGVHLLLDRDGSLSQHADLASEVCVHANQLNATSVGIEIVNPYAPSLAYVDPIETIPARWWTWCPVKADRRYVLPTPEQLDRLLVVIPWLCATLGIPYVFPTAGLTARQRKIIGWDKRPRARPAHGVVAHRDFSTHADGRYPLEYLIAAQLLDAREES